MAMERRFLDFNDRQDFFGAKLKDMNEASLRRTLVQLCFSEHQQRQVMVRNKALKGRQDILGDVQSCYVVQESNLSCRSRKIGSNEDEQRTEA